MKHLLRNLAYASVIISALTGSVHNIRGDAVAQSGTTVRGVTSDALRLFVLMPNGDVHRRQLGPLSAPAEFLWNFWGGGTSAQPQSWGQIKFGSNH